MDLRFDNRALRSLPADPETRNFTRQVHGAAHSFVDPTPVADPRVLCASPEVCADLGLTEADVRTEAFAQVFAGNRVLTGMQTTADCYGGHQFGNWAGQLGDGRAINLGEAVGPDGVHRVLQLKGAGPTPYSRSGDGRAVLRSSLREFLCSEAMHHLGVPTTRALSLVLTGDEVLRDMFYDGRAALEPGAIVCRVAPSFTRFGTFELPASRGDAELLGTLLEHCIATQFDGVAPAGAEGIAAWYAEVARRTAALVVEWERVGFVHGVLNTDNLSILGLTIDYGPYGWLDDYDPNWTPNTTDAMGRRYRFGAQAEIAHWNLLQLGNAVAGLAPEVGALQAVVDGFPALHAELWDRMMGAKLGARGPLDEESRPLARELLEILAAAETDMTLFFRGLARVELLEEHAPDRVPEALAVAYYDPATADGPAGRRLVDWLGRYAAWMRSEGRRPEERRAAMDAVNPKYVLRNYLAQQAIDRATEGDVSECQRLFDLLRRPYDEQPEHEEWAAKRPEWARHRPGCSMLSCSS